MKEYIQGIIREKETYLSSAKKKKTTKINKVIRKVNGLARTTRILGYMSLVGLFGSPIFYFFEYKNFSDICFYVFGFFFVLWMIFSNLYQQERKEYERLKKI